MFVKYFKVPFLVLHRVRLAVVCMMVSKTVDLVFAKTLKCRDLLGSLLL